MTTPDAPAPTRRSLRAGDAASDTGGIRASTGLAGADTTRSETLDDDTTALLDQIEAQAARSSTPRRALTWIDDDTVAARNPRRDLGATAGPYALAHADLLARRPHRSPLRASIAVPLVSLVALIVAAYVAATLLWPLHALPPTVTPVVVSNPVAPAAAPAWPGDGAAATAVDGLGSPAATTADAASIASITKLVTALLVLDQMPLAVGEQGPEFVFTAADSREYRSYLADDQSALDVPVGGVLTQYQMLQGVLIGSANNYADRLVTELWPNETVYARAANAWLDQHGAGGVTVVDSSGIDPDNAADPASVIALGRAAMANPVIAEIVAQRSVELPGAGLVESTNSLLENPAVVGVKTGGLTDFYNLVAAQDAEVAGVPVRAYAVVLGQPDDDTRDAATAALLDRTLAEVAASPPLTAGTVAGTVTTAWGASSDVLTSSDVLVALWNGQVADAATAFTLGDARSAGDAVGELTLAGPLGSAATGLELASDIAEPDPWWRLTHPLHLWGLAG